MQSKKIYITEIATISALGSNFSQLTEGLRGSPVTTSVKDFEFHTLDREVICFALRNFVAEEVLGKKGLRNKDNATKMLLGALELGFKDVMERMSEVDRAGICIGTAFGSIQSIGDFLSDSIVNGVNNVNPQAFANTVINSPTGNANIRFTARNLSATIATGFNAGLDSIIYACDLIRRGYYDRIVAGGLEEISYYSLIGLERTGILSFSGNPKPFAVDADGCVPGEGCALFMLETEESANARGAKIIAEILGTANGFDSNALDGTSDGSVGRATIEAACADGSVTTNAIDLVASGASGNKIADTLESAAIMGAFGGDVPVTAYKSFTGECYGASGALNLACTIADMKQGRISGRSGNYATVDKCPLVFESMQKTSNHAMVISMSCEGNCSALVIKNVN